MAYRRGIVIGVLVVLVAWVAAMVGLSRWQSGRTAGRGPALLHYPGTESVKEQLVPNLGWRKYWFTSSQDYPSTEVYQFYQNELVRQGWRRIGAAEPQWVRVPGEKQERDLFQATWVSADRVYQVDLQMASTVSVTRAGKAVTSEKRKPGIEVYVTLQRSMGPWLLAPEGTGEPPPGAIDLKETGR